MSIAPRIKHSASYMEGLLRAGFPAIIPLGGDDGKRPLMSGWPRIKLSADTVLRRMESAGSRTYGVRLDGLLVVDLDTATPESVDYLDDAFPPTPFIVQTSRGQHRYYRNSGPAPKAIRTDKIAIDFKSGPAAFVVGPGSVRPDGHEYVPLFSEIPNVAELPVFREYRPTVQASKIARKSGETIRQWCDRYGIGRQASGVGWRNWAYDVSLPGLLMVLARDWGALESFRAGERNSDLVAPYFKSRSETWKFVEEADDESEPR